MANETTQTLKSALEYEKSCQPRADLFYTNRYPGQTIYRPDWETGKTYQKMDIDVIVRSTAENGWPLELKISEKFRTQPWPDILIEVYDDFEKRTPGWSKETAADWHFFFHEHKWIETKRIKLNPTLNDVESIESVEIPHDESFVRLVPTWAIRKMWAICNDLFEETFEDMLKNKVHHRETAIGNDDITLMLVPTKVNGKTAYLTACACVPPETFKQLLNCEIEELKY